MSAFIISDISINLMVGFYALKHRSEFTVDEAKQMAQTLIDENYQSVNHRYYEQVGPHRTSYTDKWRGKALNISAIQILKLCDCYDYQACETDDYPMSLAFKYNQRIRLTAIHSLPGYDDAKWVLSEKDFNGEVIISL